MNQIVSFFREAWSELRQVAWLTVPQMVASTWLVVILVVIMALYIGGVDFIISRIFAILV